MQAAFHELPLAVFTTLGPIGAGAFIALAVAIIAGSLTDEQLARLDKKMIVPAVVAIIGFGASVAHLGDAGHMFGAVAGVVAVVGAVTAAVGLGGMAASVSGMSTYVASGAGLVSGALPFIAGGLVLVAASAACTWFVERKGASGIAWAAVALAVVGAFLCRLAFYGMQLSVGLSL